ncbi:MAG: ankyrin repeat domain-containing protein [Desulfuromonadales bacterium]|nr:ankyrin repeat domain-containing protein [Desulfuromonadales bacterium]
MTRNNRYVFIWLNLLSCLIIQLTSTPVFAGSLYEVASGKDLEKGIDLVFVPDFGVLHAAAQNGDLAKVRALLAKGADVNERYGNNDGTPLLFAAWNGHTKVVNLLIAHGANVNARDGEGSTSLHYAAMKGYVEVASLLIARHADINAKDNEGDRPLHDAVRKGKKNVVKVLLAHGADVNATSSGAFDATPLHMAVQRLDVDLISLLLDHGANVNAKFEIHLTPLGLAFRMAHRGERNPNLMSIIGLLALKGGNPTSDYEWNVYLEKKDIEFIVDSLPDGLVAVGDKRDFTRFILYAGTESTSPALSKRILAKFTPLAQRQELNKIIALIRNTRSDNYPLLILNMALSRETILKTAIVIAHAINPPPTVSEDALRRLAEGNVEFKTAMNKKNLHKAEESYFKAVNLAPWWPDAYYNLAVAQEILGEQTPNSYLLHEAVWNYKFYLLAAPDAHDAMQTQMKIYEMESLEKKRR